VVYAAELARRYPQIVSVSVHPGVVETGLVTELSTLKKVAVYLPNRLLGKRIVSPEEGCYNHLWCAVGARRADLVNGGLYYPVGVLSNDQLDATAKDPQLASKLWSWTQEVLDKF
jgi:hypothetical protein